MTRAVLMALLLLACSQSKPEQAPALEVTEQLAADEVPTADDHKPTAQEVPVAEDFATEAEAAIDRESFKTELDRLEAEINADDAR